MPFFYVDWYYIVLVLPAVILSLWASAHVKSTFRRYSQVRNARGMTGAEAAMAVLPVQYARHYAPIYIRAAIVPVTNIGSRLSMPLIVLGLALSGLGQVFYYVALAGVACYGLCVVFQLVTLPTEFNASHRALRAIEESALLLPEEQTAAKRVLTAAALTYVAALSVTIMQFLRLLLIVAGGNRRRD